MRYQDHGQFVGFGRSSLHLTMFTYKECVLFF